MNQSDIEFDNLVKLIGYIPSNKLTVFEEWEAKRSLKIKLEYYMSED